MEWRRYAATGAVVTGISLGMRGGPDDRDGTPVVEEAPDWDDDGEPIVLYFHPEVPEATLVLVRRGVRARAART